MGIWGEVELLTRPRFDGNLTLIMPGHPSMRGFTPRPDGGVWERPGWRAVEWRGKRGELMTRATAEADELAEYGLDIAEMEDARVTRADICIDLQGECPVCLELYDYLSGGRKSDGHKRSDFGRSMTIYYGGDRSPVRLRIYTKAYKERPPPAWLERLWGGWDGRPVTRVEFQLQGRAVKHLRADDLARELGPLWRDATSRIVLKDAPLSRYKQAQNAPESPAWKRIRGGECKRIPRSKEAESMVGVETYLFKLLCRFGRAGADVTKVLERYRDRGGWVAEDDAKAAKRAEKRLKQEADFLWRLERDMAQCVHEESREETGECEEGSDT